MTIIIVPSLSSSAPSGNVFPLRLPPPAALACRGRNNIRMYPRQSATVSLCTTFYIKQLQQACQPLKQPSLSPSKFEMSSHLINYASRVLSVDQESSSFVPVVGLNKAADMPIFDAMMLAWRECAKLHVAIDEDDIEVRADVTACA